MKKAAIIVAIVLTSLGAMIFTGALFATGFDFSKFSGDGQMTEKTFTVNEDFRNIEIDVKVSDVEFRHAEDGICKVVALESEKIYHTVAVENGTLKINSVTEPQKWFDFSWFSVKTPSVTVYLPESICGELKISATTGDIRIPDGFAFEKAEVEASTGDVEIQGGFRTMLWVKTTTGDIRVRDISCWDMDLEVSTGKITVKSVNCGYYSVASMPSTVQYGQVSIRVGTGALVAEDLSCGTLESTGGTGRIQMKNVVTRNGIFLKRGTGDIRFESCDAENGMITMETSTGEVRGSFKTGKIFTAKSSTGHIRVPDSTTGIPCKITTSTGDIEITLD